MLLKPLPLPTAWLVKTKLDLLTRITQFKIGVNTHVALDKFLTECVSHYLDIIVYWNKIDNNGPK